MTSSESRRAMYLILLLPIVFCSACATTFDESHYFQSLDPHNGQPTNYYRLKVSGYGAMSSTRYISGYYDERAVDLFFNEVKASPTAENGTGLQTLFVDNQKLPGETDVLKPLSPSTHNGAFVMILSTNASSVARTIGQFAENQVVADAVTNLANRDVLLRDTNAALIAANRANATASELARLMALVPASDAASAEEAETALLRILNALGTGLSSSPTTFQSFDEAEIWFAGQSAERGTP